ncbi:hypothetical protein LCGC14_2785760, partial [marine sediment metagenome]
GYVYVGCGAGWGWDQSPESSSSHGLQLEEVIGRMKDESSTYYSRYAAVYRHLGEGVAELVYSKNQENEPATDIMTPTDADIQVLRRMVVDTLASSFQHKRSLLQVLDSLKQLSMADWILKMKPEELAEIIKADASINIEDNLVSMVEE